MNEQNHGDADGPKNLWLTYRSRSLTADVFEKDIADRQAAGENVHGEADFVQSIRPTGTVLDGGCGIGQVARELAKRGYKVVGVDIDAGLVDRARVRAPEL